MRGLRSLSMIIAAAMVLQLFGAALTGGNIVQAADSVASAGLPGQWDAVKMFTGSNDPGATEVSFTDKQFTLSAEKGKIDSGGDNVVYAYMPVTGEKDFTFTVRISQFEFQPSNSWAMLMVKDGDSYDSKMASIGVDYNGGNIRLRDYRRLATTGGGNDNLGNQSEPVIVKMERSEKNLQFSYSIDGGRTYSSRTNYNNDQHEHYTLLNQPTLNVGFAVASGSAVFDQVTFVVDGQTVFDSEAVDTDETPPAAPDGLIAIPKNEAVDLTWNIVAGATYYKVKSSLQEDGPYEEIAEVSGNSYTADNLTNGTAYYFTVAAGNTYGISDDSEPVPAIPAGLTAPGLYEMAGFSAYNTGGGSYNEDDPAYRKVHNAVELGQALTKNSGVKVIEIMNDLDLGWNEIAAEARTAPFSKHNEPLLHPVLIESGVSKITVDGVNGLTIFSANGSKIRHAALTFKNSSNIIIRNLEFDELWEWDEATKGDYDRNDWDYISLENATSKVWIDHCTFNKAYDGVVDAKGGSNGITISWSKFRGDDGSADSWVSAQIEALHKQPDRYPMYNFLLQTGLSKSDIIAVASGQKKGHLIGASEMAADNSELELTLHHNYYQDMMDRIPRLRAGNAHIYNIVVDSSKAHTASKLITDEMVGQISAAGFHFGVTSNGAISTENGALLLENSVMTDVIYPIRNNQKEDLNPAFTGKIKAANVRYSLDGTTYTGDSDTPDSPLTPVPAELAAFSWNTESGGLPYLYELDSLEGLQDKLSGTGGAGAGRIYWNRDNWLKTSAYAGEIATSPVAPPTIVSGLQAKAGDGEISLRWGSVGAASSYNLYRSLSADGPFEAAAHDINTASYADKDLVNGTVYYYQVSAVNGVGEGPLSGSVSAAPFKLTAPAAPSGLTATSASTKIILDWEPAALADYYTVSRSTKSGTDDFTVIASKWYDTSYEDFTASEDTIYYYIVTAVNSAGESAASEQVSAQLVDLTEIEELKLLFHDTFDDETAGELPSGYEVSEESGYARIADIPDSANKSLEFFDDRAGVVQADKSFEAQSKVAAVEFDFMHEAKANSIKVMRLAASGSVGATGNNYAAVAIETNGGNLSYRTNTGYEPILTNYSAGVWYTIRIIADIEKQKADVYVNGELVKEQIGFFNPVEDLAVIQSFTANNNSANTYYLDNIKVYGENDEEQPGEGPGEGPGDGYNGGPVIIQPSVTETPTGVALSITPAYSIEADGTRSSKATISSTQFAAAVQSLAEGKSVITLILADKGSTSTQVEIPAAAIAAALAQHSKLTLVVRTASGDFSAPLGSFSIEELAQANGLALEQSSLTLSVKQLQGDAFDKLKQDALEAGMRLLTASIDYEAALVSGGVASVITDFGGAYVTRRLPLAAAVNAARATGALYDPETGHFSFVPTIFTTGPDEHFAELMNTRNSIYTVIEGERSFADLEGHWSRAEVEQLASKLIVSGVSAESFAPDRNITRAEFAALLVRGLGLTPAQGANFIDVDDQAWYAGEVAAAEKAGLVNGYADGSFRPNAAITREQIAVMLARALQVAGADTPEIPADGLLARYIDDNSISGWARASIALAVEAKIMQGTAESALLPARSATRAESAAMLARLLKYVHFINE